MLIMYISKSNVIMWTFLLCVLCIPGIYAQDNRQVLNTGPNITTMSTTEGQIIDFKCTDLNYTDEYYIIWYRISEISGNETEIYRNGSLQMFSPKKEQEGYSINNSTDFQLTLSIKEGLGKLIHGNGYRCEVKQSNNSIELVYNSTYTFLNVTYPPSDGYPRCEAERYYNDSVGQNITMTCGSQMGNPYIIIELWRDNMTIASKSVAFQSNNRSEVVKLFHQFTFEEKDLEARYQCKVIWMEESTCCTFNETSHKENNITKTPISISTTSGHITTPEPTFMTTNYTVLQTTNMTLSNMTTNQTTNPPSKTAHLTPESGNPETSTHSVSTGLIIFLVLLSLLVFIGIIIYLRKKRRLKHMSSDSDRRWLILDSHDTHI